MTSGSGEHTLGSEESCDTDSCFEQIGKSVYDTPKVILLWTTFFGSKDYGFGLGQKPFIDAECKVTNCELTTDKGRSGQADAVLFHMRNVDKRMKWPEVRSMEQRLVTMMLHSRVL